MTVDDLPPSSRPVDRAALERVLARAAELQGTSGDPGDAAGDLTEAQIVDLGKEVGLSPPHLRQALAEERTRAALPVDQRSLQSSLFGPARVRASRVLTGTPEKTLSGINVWMQREECLQVKRQLSDRILWEPRRDLIGNIRRALNIGGRGYALTHAAEVAGTVAPVDETRVVVTLEADLSVHRARLAAGVGAASLVAAAASGALALVVVFPWVSIVPVAVVPLATFVGARTSQASAAKRAQLALEQLLDQLERGDLWREPSILSALAAAATAAATLPRRT
ncbi:MAG TPA: hypothetical protein VMH39_04105 [Gemmatimonadaceae bacterium]|nr:hypothetical protein [Gemmatimonadaceae bacterium]